MPIPPYLPPPPPIHTWCSSGSKAATSDLLRALLRSASSQRKRVSITTLPLPLLPPSCPIAVARPGTGTGSAGCPFPFRFPADEGNNEGAAGSTVRRWLTDLTISLKAERLSCEGQRRVQYSKIVQ